jgi:hypothetical protein
MLTHLLELVVAVMYAEFLECLATRFEVFLDYFSGVFGETATQPSS